MVHPRNSMIARGSRLSSNRSIDLQSGEYWRVLARFASLLSISFVCSPALGHQAQIYGGTGCINAPQLEKKIIDILNTTAPARADTRELTARMALSLSADHLSLSIKRTNQFGRVALARRYQLHRADCPDVPALIQLVLEEFLREFPENPWQIDADAEVITDRATTGYNAFKVRVSRSAR